MKKLVSLLVAGVMLFSLCAAVGAEEPAKKTLTVAGTYVIAAPADEAYVTFGIVTENADFKACQADNSKKSNEVIAAVKSLGIEEKDIKTAGYNSVTLYDYEKASEYPYTQNKKFRAYQITHMLMVSLTDVSLAGKVVDITVEKNVNQLNNVQFALSRPKQHQLYLDALKGASSRAQDKGAVLKEAFGLSDLTPASISADNYSPYVTSRNYAVNSVAPGGVMDDGGGATVIMGGEIEVSATVAVVYTY